MRTRLRHRRVRVEDRAEYPEVVADGESAERGMVGHEDATVVGNRGQAVPDVPVEYPESGIQVQAAGLNGHRVQACVLGERLGKRRQGLSDRARVEPAVRVGAVADDVVDRGGGRRQGVV